MLVGEKRCVTTLITAAKETRDVSGGEALRDDPDNGCEGD